MDPITHVVVSCGLFTLANPELTPVSASLIGNVIGSLAPDFDIVLRFLGPISYLKNHRVASHSFMGIAVISATISLILSHLPGLPSENFFQIFIWTLLGALSHSFLDFLNSHGIKFLWPFSYKTLSFPLLNIFDPFLITPFILIILIPKHKIFFAILAFMYLLLRFYIRYKLKAYLKMKFRKKDPIRILVMPSLYSIFSWTFIIETHEAFYAGNISSAPKKIYGPSLKKLFKEYSCPFTHSALNSKYGRFFKGFTPLYHIQVDRIGQKYLVKFTDLRYLLKDRFLHSATVTLSQEGLLLEGLFHPFSPNNSFSV